MMRRNRSIFALLSLVLCGGVGLWLWLGRDSSQLSAVQMMNEQGSVEGGAAMQSSKRAPRQSGERGSQWEASKNTQNIDSIVLSFKRATDCLAYHDALNEVQSMLNDKDLDDLSTETLATLRNLDASSARNISLVQRLDRFCKGSDKNQLVETFSIAVLDAALKGNSDAQTCFLLMGPSPWQGTGSIPSQDSAVARYTQYAPEFIQKSLERADPRVAVRALYSYVDSPQGHASFADGLPKPDPVLTWRSARLASLRASPEQRTEIERQLTALGKTGVISPSAMADGDDWAKRKFYDDFVGQPPINIDSPVPCYSSADLAP